MERPVLGAVRWAAAGFVAALLAGLVVSNLAGYRSLAVMSGSMTPVLRVGDLVIDRPVAPGEVRIGDIITFRDPADPNRLVTHRVRSIRSEGGTLVVETKGDANNSVQRWSIDPSGRLGKVVVRVPSIGYAIHWVAGPIGRLALVVIPSLLLGGHALLRIWRPRVVA